jgi:hypothetical protein
MRGLNNSYYVAVRNAGKKVVPGISTFGAASTFMKIKVTVVSKFPNYREKIWAISSFVYNRCPIG